MSRLPLFFLLTLFIHPIARAAEQDAAVAKMRDILKATMLQQRAAETARDAAVAAQAEAETKSKTLTEQVAAQGKQLAADKDANDKKIAALETKLAEREAELAQYKAALEKLKVAEKKAAELAATKEVQREKLAGETIVLQRKVADQQVRNLAMFKLGKEILARYEKFGLGDALTAREPFIGITRVKFENLIQDFGDKLNEQRINQ